MNHNTQPQWQPSAALDSIRLRAQILKTIRQYFEQQNVLEVDTPVLSHATITDPCIESFQTRYVPLTQVLAQTHYYLHTSPEFAMKRLLAAGSGSIYQITKVFRQGETGSKHNPEFTLLEWYREAWDHHQLMRDVDHLLTAILGEHIKLSNTCFISYQQVFEQFLGLNPHQAGVEELSACAAEHGLDNVLDSSDNKDRYLELLFSHLIEPGLGIDNNGHMQICFLYHYPATQASLARLSKENGYEIAERFEVFINGMELGNGFHELNNASEQRQRFESDNRQRKMMGLDPVPLDEYFLQAVDHLPDCAGVAIGIERLLMLLVNAKHINDVITFPFERA